MNQFAAAAIGCLGRTLNFLIDQHNSSQALSRRSAK
jgi:hypothetical protein